MYSLNPPAIVVSLFSFLLALPAVHSSNIDCCRTDNMQHPPPHPHRPHNVSGRWRWRRYSYMHDEDCIAPDFLPSVHLVARTNWTDAAAITSASNDQCADLRVPCLFKHNLKVLQLRTLLTETIDCCYSDEDGRCIMWQCWALFNLFTTPLGGWFTYVRTCRIATAAECQNVSEPPLSLSLLYFIRAIELVRTCT